MQQTNNNSITENSTRNDTINSISLELSADIENKLQIIVIEGEADIRFLRDKVVKVDVVLKESYSGWEGVETIVAHFNSDQVIGIRDKDYSTPVSSSSNFLFYYDYSCLEMMLIASDDACNSFIPVYCWDNRSPIQIRDYILSSLSYLSYFRFQNAINSWGIKFKGISISNMFKSSPNGLKKEDILSEIQKVNNENIANFEEKRDLLNEQLTEISLDVSVNLLDITNGHDFMNFFQALHATYERNKGKIHKTAFLETALYAAYRLSDFEKTQLYSELKLHEERYSKTILTTL